MKFVIHFKDGQQVTINDWDQWNIDLAGHKDVIELFKHYKKVNKELEFTNPATGTSVKRFAEDVQSIEIVFVE